MKKSLLWLAVVLLITGIAGYRPLKEALKDKPVEKNILVTIYKGNNYTSKIYDSSSAQIDVTVEKVKGTKRSIVWNRSFDAKLLKQYPSIENAWMQEITIPGLSKKEHLEVNYILRYNSNGNELQMQGDTVILDTFGKLYISI